ncbi:fibronectin type III domain-containing protein [Oleidesulfovibrio sp.]|uniref:fibronectin type III domain-containing protein n=1 Tax=Oleidesulfovibrio sp. TaxID=2909707 RepID=UPI003A8B0BA6
MQADGGPKRGYTLQVKARNQAGESAAGALAVNDPVPSVPVNISGSASADSVTITWTPVPGDVTGYIALRGASASFAATAAVETKTVTAASVTFSGLAAGTDHYFRIVAKDAYADLTGEYDDLAPFGVLTVRTLAE